MNPYFDKESDNEQEESKFKNLRERFNKEFIERRQVFLWGAVTDKSAEQIVEKLFYLEYTGPGKPIYLFINSPGGVITSGMAIYDVMRSISSPVYTVTIGMAASMGAILFCAGVKGHRYILEHAKIMIHQPLISGQIVAPAVDIKIRAEEIRKTRNEINQILAKGTGKSLAQIEKDTDRDFYMSAGDSLKYGIADVLLKELDQLTAGTKGTKKQSKPSKPIKKPGATKQTRKKTR